MNTMLTKVNTKHLNMVILEDDLSLIDVYDLVFSCEALDYKICNNSDQFYSYLCSMQVRPDVLVMDIMMDSMSNNGLSMLEQISQMYGNALPPVILASALPQHMYCNQPIVRKIHPALLPKPFGLPDFFRVVNRLTHHTFQYL